MNDTQKIRNWLAEHGKERTPAEVEDMRQAVERVSRVPDSLVGIFRTIAADPAHPLKDRAENILHLIDAREIIIKILNGTQE